MRCSDTSVQRQIYAALKKKRKDLKPLCGFRHLVEPEKEEKIPVQVEMAVQTHAVQGSAVNGSSMLSMSSAPSSLWDSMLL